MPITALDNPENKNYKMGVFAYNKGDYQNAHWQFIAASDQGSAGAEYYLALMYFEGSGVFKDLSLADNWLRRSANHGDAQYQYLAGITYINGKKLPQNYLYGNFLLELSAAQNYVAAIRELAFSHLEGRGKLIDVNQAIALFKRAAFQDDLVANLYLANMYLEGKLVNKDPEQAIFYYERSANLGLAAAQNILGTIYSNGVLAPIDKIQSYLYFSLAARTSFMNSATQLSQLKASMTPRQIQAGDLALLKWSVEFGALSKN